MQGNEILQTMDARDWAKEFLEINPNCGIEEGVMIGWFANAIMCGWDHHRFSTKEYKRWKARFMRSLNPWWSWKRYMPFKSV